MSASAFFERARRALERPAAVAWKDLLIFGRQSSGWKDATGAFLLLGPLVAVVAVLAESAGPWRHGAHALALGVAAIFSTLSFAVTVAAATSVALERDRDTLPALVVSPLTPGELVLGKLLAAVANSLGTKALAFPALAIAYAVGGLEAGFIPRFFLVILAADVSFASFALALSSRPLRPPRLGSPALKLGVSQAQLALQRSVGFSVLASLVPVYTSIFGLPLVLQQGLPLGRWLDQGGAFGALHPLFTIVAWGPVRLYGHSVPVWALAVVFHLLLALPLLASAAESQRAAGAERGRLPRVAFSVWFVYVVGVAAGALGDRAHEGGSLIVAALGGALLVGAALGAASTAPGRRPFGRRDVFLALFDPRQAAASAPETAPAAVFALAVVLGLFVASTASSAGAAVRATGGLGLAALGIACLGARLAARAQARDAAAFERAVAKPREKGAGAAPTGERGARTEGAAGEGGENAPEPSTGASTVFAAGLLFLALGPALAGLGIALGRGALPQLEPLEPAFRWLAVVALAANPFSALVPLVDPQGPIGVVLAQRVPAVLGVDASSVASLGAAIWAVVVLVSFATLRRAPEVKLQPGA